MWRVAAVRVVLASLVCAALVRSGLAQVQRSDSKEGAERTIVLLNEHLKVVLFPDLGGRIGHLVDLRGGDDLLYWDLSKTAVYHGEGGALDDRKATFEPYKVAPAAQGYPPDAVRLIGPGDNPAIEKTITLLPGQATIRADYVYRNLSQEALTDYQVMTKNWFMPSGGGVVTTDDLYCLPTSRGVRRMIGIKGNWGHPELRGKFQQDVGPWNGFLSVPKRRGVAIAFSNDYYRWFYWWESGVTIPTYEWVFGGLPAGQQATITVWIHVVRGMDSLSFANSEAAASVKHDAQAGQLKTAVWSAAAALAKARVETEVRRLPDGLPVRIEDMPLGQVPQAGAREAAVAWKPERDGTYVVRQRLLEDRTILAEYEEPFVVGKPSEEYIRPQPFPAKARLTAVPGWQAVAKEDVVRPSAEDAKAGYVMYLDQFAAKAERGKPANRIELHMGRGEIKTFGFRVRALADLKAVAVAAEPAGAGPERIEVFGVERVNVSDEKVGKTNAIGDKLVPWTPRDMKKGEDAPVWGRVRTAAADEGVRTMRVGVTTGGQTRTFEVVARVWPVDLPRPNLISLETEHSTTILPGCWNAETKTWNMEVIERYTRDLGEHLTDFEQAFWGWFTGARDNGMLRLATTGQPMSEFLKGKPDFDQAPPLDFSYLNPVFDAAIRNGMVRFSTNAEPLPPKPPVAWLMREAARYLRDRGYPDEDIWAKHKDEQPATSFPVMIEDVQWLRQNGYRPYHTFNHVLAIPEYMADLKRAFDMYQGGFSTRGDTEARVKDGSLKPGDEVWMYQGWGATWIAYEHNRRPGWFAAGAELDGYHVHVYYRWHMLDAIIFPSADGPTGSPAWEAIRDGFADAQYVALARRWIEKLERNGQKDAADKACKALARIVGAEDSVVPIQRRRERLLWVEAVPSFDMDTAERARAALLELLAGMTPAVAKLGPSLYYGVEPLALDGKVALAIAPGANAAGAEALKAVLVKRFGIQPVAAQAARVVVDLQVGSVPGAWQATNPHITGIYPGPGEYVVHAPPADKAGSRRILIFGRDEAGLKKGIEMWSCFLRSERRGR